MKSLTSPYKVTPKYFKKTLRVPTSKSHANRLLVLAAISEGEVELIDLPESSDVMTMLTCLQSIGLEMRGDHQKLTIINSFPACESELEKEIILETGDGGTTNRFLIPLLSLGKKQYHIIPSERMKERPMEDLYKVLEDHGVSIKRDGRYYPSLRGPFLPREKQLEIEASKTTQFATGLALSLWKLGISITPVNMQASAKYWDLTLKLIEKFKDGEDCHKVPVDFSSLSYPLALALVGGEVTIPNCTERDFYQADSVFLDLIEKMGGELVWSGNGIHLKTCDEIKPLNIDCSGFPDLVPTLAFVCANAKGTSTLSHLEVLRHKESDRITEILHVLKIFKVDVKFDEDLNSLEIIGKKERERTSVEVSPPSDHRIIMMNYLFMRIEGGGLLQNYHHVKKSFPHFFELMD